MNLDIFTDTGKPDPAYLTGIPYVRLLYNVSRGVGSQDFGYAFSQHNTYITALQAAGKKVIIVLNHQAWGEGVPGWPRWEEFQTATWQHFTSAFVERIAHNIIQRFAGRSLIYQLWNEPDSLDGRASVRMPAASYGVFFRAVSQVIRQFDSSAKIITAGLNSGPENAYRYFKDAGITPDGIAIHEYGRGAANNPNYRPFGTMEYSLDYWRNRTNIPIWLTEFGVLDQPNEPENKVADYARDFVKVSKAKGAEAVCWYAYGRMDNCYGIIAPDGHKREVLLAALKYDAGTNNPQPPTQPQPDARGFELSNIPTRLNFRTNPTINGPVLRQLSNGDIVQLTDETVTADGYRWRKIVSYGSAGWVAVRGNGLSIEVKL